MLVYDITDYHSFADTVKYLPDDIYDECDPSIVVIMIVGNKCDLCEKREVTTEEAKQFAGILYNHACIITS